MSRDEFDLRAALREGEGEQVKVGLIIGRAEALRHARRNRLLTAAAAVVAVGALGTGIGLLHNLGMNNSKSASSAGVATGRGPERANSAPQADVPHTTGAGSAADAAGGSTASCPVHPAGITFPAPGAPGTSGSLFGGTVTSITLCGYRAEQTGGQAVFDRSAQLTGARAAQLADSLEAAPTRFEPIPCPNNAFSAQLVLYPSSGSGPLDPVLVDPTCGVSATDGTAARYRWNPPAEITTVLDALTN